MGRNEQFEWVNAWAEAAKAKADSAETEAVVKTAPADEPGASSANSNLQDNQLTHDIAAIKRARDALAALPVGTIVARRRTQALTLVPARTGDRVPVVIGGVLALVMLTVFGAAAAMTKLSR